MTNIVVLIKQVPDTWSERKLSDGDWTLDRDAADAVPAGQLNHLLGNPEGGRPVIEACAVQGTGVFQTLNAIARLVLRNFQSQASGLAVS